MIAQARGESRKYLIGAGAALVVLLALVVGLWMREPVDASGGVLSPEQIAQKNVGSVVWFEVSWKLIHTGTGNQIYHQHKSVKTNRGVERAPLYITTDGRSYEPVLTLSLAGNAPIGGSHGGSGFVITSDGFILTNRHVAAAWYAPYDLPGGIVIDEKGNEVGTVRSGPSNWIPAQAIRNRRSLTDKPLEGRNDILNVTFPENKLRIPAQPARISDEHDVAMVKINLPDAVPKVEMYDNYDSIKQGAPIVVIGYPLGANPQPLIEPLGAGADKPSAGVIVPDATPQPARAPRTARRSATNLPAPSAASVAAPRPTPPPARQPEPPPAQGAEEGKKDKGSKWGKIFGGAAEVISGTREVIKDMKSRDGKREKRKN
jgi:hypothetical protein